MRSFPFLLPLVLGAFTVLQAGLNRKIGGRAGLPAAVLLNAVWLATMATAVFFLLSRDEAGEKIQNLFRGFSWWYLLPGFFGLSLVWGIPESIKAVGAQTTFVLLIAAQMAMSVYWDWRVEGLAIPMAKVMGCVLAWAGALLVLRAP